jgi:hypothetical protein
MPSQEKQPKTPFNIEIDVEMQQLPPEMKRSDRYEGDPDLSVGSTSVRNNARFIFTFHDYNNYVC